MDLCSSGGGLIPVGFGDNPSLKRRRAPTGWFWSRYDLRSLGTKGAGRLVQSSNVGSVGTRTRGGPTGRGGGSESPVN